jgi:hypothetical protein
MNEIAGAPDEFASVFETSFAHLQIRIEEACDRGGEWPASVAAAIFAAFDFASVNPQAAGALAGEALAAGSDGVARHRRLLAYMAGKLAPGREQRPQGAELPPLTEQALAGGLLSVVAERLAQGGASELPALAPEAVQFVLTPYLGAAEARRIAAGAHPPEG